MANAYTATTDVAGFIPNYYSKVFLERLQPEPIMMQYCVKKPLPQNNGKTAYFPRMVVSSTTVSAYKVAEGTVISTEKIDDAQVSAIVEQFANAKALWDLTELTAISSTVEETVVEIADQAKNIIDRRIIDEAYGTSATPWGGSGFSCFSYNTAAATADVIAPSVIFAAASTTEYRMTAATLRAAVKKLKGRNVSPLDDGFYALICHSDTAMQLQADSSWQAAYRLLVSLHGNVMKNICLNSGNTLWGNPDLTRKEKGNDYEQTNILELCNWNGIRRLICNTFETAKKKLYLENKPFNEAKGLLPI